MPTAIAAVVNRPRLLLGWVAALCGGFLLYALYLQHFQAIYPCPLCVLQRYAFLSVALVGTLGLVVNAPAVAAGIGFIVSLAGGAIAAYQLWIIAHPAISCGRDLLEQAVNGLYPAKILPALFKAEGFCNDLYEPILGLTTPQWSLVWFAVFALLFLSIVMRSRGK